jgi:hypothetical protein
MKKIYKSIIFIVAAVFLVSACTDDFEKINTRWDRPTSVEPEYLFGLTTLRTLREIAGGSFGGGNSEGPYVQFVNHTNQLSTIGGSGPAFQREERGTWNGLYVHALNPLFQIVKNYGVHDGDSSNYSPGHVNRVAIAKIWRSYVFSQLVGLYGPLPYVDACNGKPAARFDSEYDIYVGILTELKEAYESFNYDNALIDRYPAAADPFLGGTPGDDGVNYLKRWASFARCIRLNVAMRLSNMLPDDGINKVNYANSQLSGREDMLPVAIKLQEIARDAVREELNNSENGLLINSNAEGFSMQFMASPENNQNPIFRYTLGPEVPASAKDGGGGNLPVIHESFVMWLYPYNDPCWRVYVTEGNGSGTGGREIPTNMGRPHMMNTPPEFNSRNLGVNSPYGLFNHWDCYARIGRPFDRPNSRFWIYNYPELVFAKAEASFLGIWTGPKTAKEYYEDGIRARCERENAMAPGVTGVSQVSAANINAYIARGGIAWDSNVDDYIEELWEDYDEDGRVPKFEDWQRLTNSYLRGPEDNYKRIVVQQWINLFMRTWDSYTLLRRTGVLTFKPRWESSSNSAYLFTSNDYASEATWAYTPQRLPYPGGEFTINSVETGIAIRNLLWDNKLRDLPEDQITYRLIYTKDAPQIGIGRDGRPILHQNPNGQWVTGITVIGNNLDPETGRPRFFTYEQGFRNLARNF